jgi:hypothetical protein
MSDAVTPQLTFPGAAAGWGWVHGVVIAVAAVLILRLFLWERRLVSRGVGWCLLGLRGAALGVVLVLLLQPTWAWVLDRERTGKLLVAIDVSESMQLTDRQATAAERLRWLKGIGWLDGATPVPAAVPGEPVDPRSLPAAPEGIDAETWRALATQLATLSRVEIARRTLLEGPDGLLKQLEPLGLVEGALFGGVSVPWSLTDPVSFPETIPKEALVEQTRLAAPLKLLSTGGHETPWQGVILFTDGRDLDAATTLSLAESLGQSGVPIFPVIVGSTERPKDLSIVSVNVPLAVYRGDKSRVKVLISTAGYDPQPLAVELYEKVGETYEARETKNLTSGDAPQLVEFDLPTDELGTKTYELRLPTWEGETRVDNNRREFTLQVVDDRTRVLLVDGSPRWEFRYLEIALARDRRVTADVVLYDQPYLQVLEQPFFPTQWPRIEATGVLDPLVDRNLVILGDVTAGMLGPEEWGLLDRYVAEQGGMLVLVAGRGGMPLGLDVPELRALLPITNPEVAGLTPEAGAPPTARGWTWSLTPEGELQTPLQLAADPASNRAVWDALPGATWGIRGEPKPGATVWAYGRDAGNAPPIPLLVHQHYGLGQVLWVATDSTWRWRFRSDDQFHHRFWGQLARYAAELKLGAGNEFVQFGPLQARYDAGMTVEFQARWSAKMMALPPLQRSAVAEIFRGDELVTQVPLVPNARRTLISQGQLTGLPPGEYRARLKAPQLDLGPKPIEAEFLVTPATTIELAELSANRTLLEAIARASGGICVTPDEVGEIPKRLKPFEAVTSMPQARPVWDRWPAFVILAAILSCEWIVRRRYGLP